MGRIVSFAAVALSGVLAASAALAETLDDAWRQALSCNHQLSAHRLEETAAVDDVAVARSERRPSAWLNSSYSVRSDKRNFKFENPLQPGQLFTAPYAQREGAGANASVVLPLYTGRRISSAISHAEARLAAASFGTKASKLDLMLAVAEAYVDVLRLRCELSVAEQTLASLAAHQSDVERHVAQQQNCKGDLLAARVATANAQQEVLRRRHAVESAQAEYNRLLDRPLHASVTLDELALTPELHRLEELQQTAFQRRPDLCELQASAEAQQFEAERIRAASRPDVKAVGRYDFDENRFQTPQAVSTAAIVVDWNVYDGGRSRRAACAELNRAASIRQLVADLQSRIALQVLREWNSQQEAIARLGVVQEALQSAEESLRVSKLRFERGMAVSGDVLDAQARRAKSASDYFNAGYDLCLADLRLKYAIGTLGPEGGNSAGWMQIPPDQDEWHDPSNEYIPIGPQDGPNL